MHGMARIRGLVLDGANRPVEGAVVTIKSAPRSVLDIAAITNADGQFLFGGLSAGTYTLELRFGASSVQMTAECKSAEEAILRFLLPR